MKYDVFGVGNPLIDVIIPVGNEVMQALGLSAGAMNLVDQARQTEILQTTRSLPRTEALGGSCGNTMVMLGQLGLKPAFLGNAGNDHFAEVYEEELVKAGVASFLVKEEGMTGSSIILVTPDGERTMNTHLGKCQDLRPDAVKAEAIAHARMIYVEGYLWDTPSQQATVIQAFTAAKKAGVKIAFSLSDSFCVARNREAFTQLLHDYVDLVFCNADEGRDMTGKSDPVAVFDQLAEWCGHAALTLGKEGALVGPQGETVKAVDTTGAGDSFAAGYLYGLAKGKSPADAARIGNAAAALVVAQMGPRYQGDLLKALAGVL